MTRFISIEFVFLTNKDEVGQILLCNHLCTFDIVSVFSEFKNCYTFVNSKFFHNPLLRPIVTACGYIVVDQSKSAEKLSSYLQAVKLINEGKRIAIFPEGTRSSNGELLKLYQGGFRLAVDTQKDVSPVFFSIDRPFLNKKVLFHWQLYPVRLQAFVLPKIDISKLPQDRTGTAALKNEFIRLYAEFKQTQEVMELASNS